ncbi:MAG: dihydroorotate dehydrogenase-like protein [Mangrovibacterium sp.]
MGKLETSYMGLKLKNPLIVGSSGLTAGVDKIAGLEQAGAAAVILKSLFEEQILGEVDHLLGKDPQNRYPEAADYIRSYTRSHSVEAHLDLLRQARKKTNIPLIASINCTSPKEWTGFATEFEAAGADALELNLFYLPTGRNESSASIEKRYLDVLDAVKKKVRIPVSVKLGSYFTNLVSVTEQLMAHGAVAVTLFNRFYEPDINLERLELGPSGLFSNPGDLRKTLRWTGIVSAALPGLEISASTGIHDGDAVIKTLLAGARTAQLCSTVYLNGTRIITGIIQELETFMDKWNFSGIDDFRGRLSYARIPDPFLYERAQFMKYFSGRD